MRVKIEVMLRDAILDPQGNTIKKSLNSLGFKNIKTVFTTMMYGTFVSLSFRSSALNQDDKIGNLK